MVQCVTGVHRSGHTVQSSDLASRAPQQQVRCTLYWGRAGGGAAHNTDRGGRTAFPHPADTRTLPTALQTCLAGVK